MQNFLRNGRQKFWKYFSFGVSPFQALLPVVTNSQACHLSADFLLPQCLCIITCVIGTPFKFFLGQTNSITHSRAGTEYQMDSVFVNLRPFCFCTEHDRIWSILMLNQRVYVPFVKAGEKQFCAKKCRNPGAPKITSISNLSSVD